MWLYKNAGEKECVYGKILKMIRLPSLIPRSHSQIPFPAIDKLGIGPGDEATSYLNKKIEDAQRNDDDGKSGCGNDNHK